jgi:Protein of Unknown function (DUF2784)
LLIAGVSTNCAAVIFAVTFPTIAFELLSGLTVIVHLVFVIFVIAGGLVVIKWPWLMSLHIPAVIWAAAVELFGWICPLTPLENWFRQRSGQSLYETDFVERWVLPVLYPHDLTRQVQIVLGLFVIIVNLVVYARLYTRIRGQKSSNNDAGRERR